MVLLRSGQIGVRRMWAPFVVLAAVGVLSCTSTPNGVAPEAAGPAVHESTTADDLAEQGATAQPDSAEATEPEAEASTEPQPPATDAHQWRRVKHDDEVFGADDGSRMRSVAAGGPGLVAVGWDVDQLAAAVWTSTDGIFWQRVTHDDGLFGGGGGGGRWMRSVTVGGPGLVAVGGDGGRGAAAVWTSTDGISWQQVPHDEAVFAGDDLQEMRSVTVGGPGLVAVGSDGPAAAVWTSADGISWQRVPHDEAVFGGANRQEMWSVAAGVPGLVAVGEDRGRNAAAVWTSNDGISWQRVPHDESVFAGDDLQEMRSVTVGGPGLVAVGYDWVREAAAAWTSNDGISWQRVPHDEAVFGGESPQVMWSVAAGGPGLVAVGNDFGHGGAAVWTSADGISWQRVPHDEAVFGGDGPQFMKSVTAGGPGLVAVGSDRKAAVWTSP